MKGFTLVEVLMALLILGVVATLVGQVLQGVIRVHELQSAEPERLRERGTVLARQFAGVVEEPVLTLTPVEPE